MNVVSTGNGAFTRGDASGKRVTPSLSFGGITIRSSHHGSEKDSVGIGAGIAVSVTGADFIAKVEDGVRFGNAVLDGVNVKASFSGTRQSTPRGRGGRHVHRAVLALAVSGVSIPRHTWGRSPARFPPRAMSRSRGKQHEAQRRRRRGRAGSGVGVGASFGIAVINDSAEATLKRSVTAAMSSWTPSPSAA